MLTEVPKTKSFVTVVLSEMGAVSFKYLQGAKPGERQVYFVDSTGKGSFTGADMLRGQFVFEFEKSPEWALPMAPGCTNRLYFGGLSNYSDGRGDKRVLEYDHLTAEEIENTRTRLTALAMIHPKATELLRYL